MLALAQPAEAEIVYTPTHHVIGQNEKYKLDLNKDGIVDLTLRCRGCDSLFASAVSGNGVASTHGTYGPAAAALRRGAHIPGLRKSLRVAPMAEVVHGSTSGHSTSRHWGAWINVKNRYLGLKFEINGQAHYGWVRLSVQLKGKPGNYHIVATLTGYAYETIPDKPIIAGETEGADVITLEPGSLGALAAGASKLRGGRD